MPKIFQTVYYRIPFSITHTKTLKLFTSVLNQRFTVKLQENYDPSSYLNKPNLIKSYNYEETRSQVIIIQFNFKIHNRITIAYTRSKYLFIIYIKIHNHKFTTRLFTFIQINLFYDSDQRFAITTQLVAPSLTYNPSWLLFAVWTTSKTEATGSRDEKLVLEGSEPA